MHSCLVIPVQCQALPAMLSCLPVHRYGQGHFSHLPFGVYTTVMLLVMSVWFLFS